MSFCGEKKITKELMGNVCASFYQIVVCLVPEIDI